MISFVDSLLDRVTTYRLMLHVLLGLLGVAAVLASLGLLPFTPLRLLV
jgi:hypothetical protein